MTKEEAEIENYIRHLILSPDSEYQKIYSAWINKSTEHDNYSAWMY